MTRQTLGQPGSNASTIESAAGGIVRLLKMVVFTVLGFALLILGLVWLVVGIGSRQPLPIAGGASCLAVLAGWFIAVTRRSRREARSQTEVATAKLAAGQRTCASCKIDFDEATSLKTPQAWVHTAIGVVLSLIPISLGGVGLWALGFSSTHSIKLLFVLVLGIAFLSSALKGKNRLYVRCPKCGRSCGGV
jgi:4-amino-4-deoxy-L-arabinose transferase-like glycosyltransferase